MNSNHRVNVVRIDEILPHPNADTLGIVYIGGYQCVVKKDAYKAGDLAVYFQPDSIVPQTKPFEFLWADKEFADGVVPERYRRITVRRFRKEYSEGLLLPIYDFAELECKMLWEGTDVAELLGVTHYEEPEPGPSRIPRTKPQYTSPFKSWLAFKYWLLHKLGLLRDPLHGDCVKPPKNAPPTYGVESFKNYTNTFTEGELVIVTEKIHGSNGRYMFDGKKMWVGSKNLWKSEKSTCIWRRVVRELPWVEEYCRTHPNSTVYGEVVPTQKGYAYGTSEEAMPIKFFVFDILKSDGTWMDKVELLAHFDKEHLVPVLYYGRYDDTVKTLVDGKSLVFGAKHIREGIVISSDLERIVRGLGRAQLKLKSLAFFEKESKC